MTTTDDAPAGPPPSPPSRGGLGSLLFRPPTEEPIPAPSMSPESPSLPDRPGASPSASGWSDDAPSLDTAGPTSSPASWADDDEDAAGYPDEDAGPVARPGGPTAPIVSKAAMRKTFREGVLITGGMAHKFGARTPGQQAAGLYLADDDDAAGIGEPLADIAARRDGIGGKLSPDANDALRAAMAFGGYIAKQLANLRVAAEHDAALTPGTDPQAHPGVDQ
jgi:hypothetical protein